MKRIAASLCLLMFAASASLSQKNDFPAPAGPYLGQQPPGVTPEIFAPGIVSREGHQNKLFLAADHSEIVFCEREPVTNTSRLISVTSTDGVWATPTVIPFSQGYINNEPTLSPDGKRLFFVSNRPILPDKEAGKFPDIWMAEKVNGRWGEPRNVGAPVNTSDIEVQPFYSTDNKLYFCRQAGDIRGVYVSAFSEGKFSEPVRLDLKTAGKRVSGPCVSPDNRVLIVHAKDEGGSGSWDLFASFRDDSGAWGELVKMGASINTELSEGDATFSPDGKYLFFTREGDIYWVASSVIEESRPTK
jgi:dipeptidyl aminopeptidase/acylaminoacyl peptidase